MQTDLANVEVVEEGEEGAKVDVFELKESADEAPVVKLVNMVLVDAIQKGASDIHFESYEKIFRIRFRMDGVLHEMLAPPKRLESAILSRLKIMSNLDIAERRLRRTAASSCATTTARSTSASRPCRRSSARRRLRILDKER
jgi:type IV pilus assembly protein PilB